MRKLWGIVGGVLLFGCRREIPLPAYEDGLSLFPLERGRTWIYEVRETTYTTTGAEPKLYFLRMRIDTPVIDAYGRLSFYVVWDTAPSLTADWGFFHVGLAYRDSSQAELWENNRRLLLLRFPLSPELRWNRYEYTDLPPESCRYLNTDTIYRVGGREFPRSCIVLRRADTVGILRKAFFYEVYARTVGLIHRYERLDVYDLRSNGTLTRSTDSYHRELRLVQP
ncbi:MAG: hypothetical protein NZ989_07150 [Bacteroidia bacterium]|nr:hypothetical protein [Bacteroidia bacterium]MDW8057601.1 hypothetical protein [Bacteroidia bacterium]